MLCVALFVAVTWVTPAYCHMYERLGLNHSLFVSGGWMLV
jgi:hypothetical protein